MGPDEALFDYMRSIHPYANLVDYMFVGDKVLLRCGICRCRPVPRTASNVLWCEDCLDTFIDAEGATDMDEWIEKRRTIPRGYDKAST